MIKLTKSLLTIALAFSFLAISYTPSEANRYGQCRKKCERKFNGRLYDKSTKRGACAKGCNNAHWSGKKRGAKQCNRLFPSGTRLNACDVGVRLY